ncbi:thiamine diphosphokinase [Maritimibacter dapengensis]|uniref:Thiamine diphosphokinase n=1 Tax=Maritimibacter dapengensis TaxID=2836868 RepID=A0ABS6T0X3_9RHOB|nr:thiamine diphosphokinase [Maritimibacter dapengensis]MBV7378256.1 thiamine diphosphokinase [Maritimibacter dapengensis]
MDTIKPRTARIEPFSETVTLLGGGELTQATVSDLLTRAPNLVACDGAARGALQMGLVPKAVIGDMDSLDAETRAQLDPATLHQIVDQDTTDFDKALRSVRAPLILGAGFMGLRLDHELACYNALVRHPEVRCILVGEHDICFHLPGGVPLVLDVPEGCRVSLFPMAELDVATSGLEWSFDKLRLAPWGRVGTSNIARGPVRIESDRDGLLVILPGDALDAAIAALTAI